MVASAAAQIQQEIFVTLRDIDGHMRELSRRVKRAKEVPEAVKDIEASIDELQDSKTTLKRCRVQLRKRMTELGAKHEMKGKLGATRTKIDQEIQGITVLEKGLHERVSKLRLMNTELVETERVASPQEMVDSAMSSPREVQELEVTYGPHDQEVKVQSCQLVAAGDLTDELVCKVCYDVVGCTPKLTKCAHLFCGDCLSQWFSAQPGIQTWAQRAHSDGLVPCPVCKEPLHEDRDLFTLNKGGPNGNGLLWRMLQQTKVRCANHSSCRADGACDWTGDYGSYQAHIRQCKNVLMTATCPTSSTESPVISPAIVAKAVDVTVEWEPRDRADSDSTLSDFLGHDNGETSSDGDLSASELSTATSLECPSDAMALDGTWPEILAQSIEKTSSNGRRVRKTVRFCEGAALVHEIPAREEITADDETVDEAAVSESLVNSINALLELKTQAKEKESIQSSQPQRVDALQPDLADKTLVQRQQQAALEMQRQQVSMAAAHAQQLAQWQHVRMAQSAYAAQWQAAHMQYAAQWKAAQLQHAAQWQATQMQQGAYAMQAALLANQRK